MIKKCFYYLGGLILLTAGQRLFVEVGWGAGSLDALCVGLSHITVLSAGTWVWITGIIMMLVSAMLYKRKPAFTVLLTSLCFGVLFDLWGKIFAVLLQGQEPIFKLLFFVIGMLLAPLGTAIYFQSGFSKSAYDDFVMAIKNRANIRVWMAKTMVEVSFCVTAYLIGGPIGGTTVVIAVAFGPILQRFLGIFERKN